MANESSRREILIASAALAGGAGAALIASCGGGSKMKSTETVSTIQMQDDAAILNTLLDMESSAVVAYELIGRTVRGHSTVALAHTLRDQELAHTEALRALIPGLGQAIAPAKTAAEYQATFPPLPGPHAALAFALDVENTAIGAYADAIAKVVTDSVRARLAAILATESEHAAVVLGRLGRPQVPQAFVTGPPPPQGSG